MSTIPMAGPVSGPTAAPAAAPVRRVRQQAREAASLMAFSAVTSVGMATCLLLLTSLAR